MRSVEDIKTTGAGWITEAEVDMLCDRIAEQEAALQRLRVIFRANMIRAYPGMSHEEIDAQLKEIIEQ
ncbi:MAG: hypothetical protein ACOYLQ_15345 [Hyphomicrobiaceae bacterium]